MTDYLLFEFVGHAQQAYALALGDTLGGHAGHHSDNLGNMTFVNGHAAAVEFLFPAFLRLLEFLLELLLLVTIAGCTLEVLGLNGLEFVVLGLGYALLQVLDFLWCVNLGDMYT